MKKLSIFVILASLLTCSSVFAQSSNNITWEMAVVKWTVSGEESFSPRRPIPLKSGDDYYFYIQASSPAYCYVVQENSDRTSVIIFNGRLTAGLDMPIPEDNDLTVPSGTGTIRYYVVVSSTPRANLDRRGTLSGAQHTALIDEIQAISAGLSIAAEAPELPVRMGGGTRGSAAINAYQYEGEDTYVKTVVITY